MKKSLSFPLLLAFIFVCYCLFFWTEINLPLFWDEATYARSLFYENPKELFFFWLKHSDLLLGHPPLFQWLSFPLTSLLGASPFSFHFYALGVSFLFLWFISREERNITNKTLISLLILTNPIFFSKAFHYLPNIGLLLLMLLSFHFYRENNLKNLILVCFAGVFYRESFLAAPMVLLLLELKGQKRRSYLFTLFLPLLLSFIFIGSLFLLNNTLINNSGLANDFKNTSMVEAFKHLSFYLYWSLLPVILLFAFVLGIHTKSSLSFDKDKSFFLVFSSLPFLFFFSAMGAFHPKDILPISIFVSLLTFALAKEALPKKIFQLTILGVICFQTFLAVKPFEGIWTFQERSKNIQSLVALSSVIEEEKPQFTPLGGTLFHILPPLADPFYQYGKMKHDLTLDARITPYFVETSIERKSPSNSRQFKGQNLRAIKAYEKNGVWSVLWVPQKQDHKGLDQL